MDIPPDEVLLKEFDGLFLEHSDSQHLFVQLQTLILVKHECHSSASLL
jgi:hypothetical protein